MHGPINVKSPNNTNKWQMGFNSAFKGLILFGLRKTYVNIEETSGGHPISALRSVIIFACAFHDVFREVFYLSV
jgi:hypothetical protein